MSDNKVIDELNYERQLHQLKQKRIIFMGTPEFAAYILKQLLEFDYNIIAVVTQPDKKVGRKQEIKFSEVKQVALENDIDIYQPIKISSENQVLLDLEPDLIITAAYGQFINQKLLDYPTHKSINVHGSLLPKYRGGAPIHYSILNGDTHTGVTIMRMTKKMDAGNILTSRSFEIAFSDNLEDVYGKMKIVGAQLLIDSLPSILTDTIVEQKQDEHQATYAYNISREDELLDFNDDAVNVYNKIRAFNPFPVAYFTHQEVNYKVFKAEYINQDSLQANTIIKSDKEGIVISCKKGAIKLIEFQPQNKKRIEVKDYVNGNNKFRVGEQIG